MNADGRNGDELPDDIPDGARGGVDDDDFGEFEGFEGGVERLQAQPAPSPWATFPDLLPVQSSPATPAEESQATAARVTNPVPREAWQPGAAAFLWQPPSNQDEHRQGVQPLRTLNPPDVSLGTNQAVGGRVTPDNVHDVEHGAVNHVGNLSLDPRLPVAQLDLLQQQLGDAEQHRAALEEQMQQLRQRNVHLEQQLLASQTQIQELQSRLQQNQVSMSQQLAEMRGLNPGDWRQDIVQLREEIATVKDTQVAERNDLQAARNEIGEVKNEICNKIQNLESNIHREYGELEQRLCTRFGEECSQIKSAIENIVQQCNQQFSGALSQLIKDTVQKNMDCSGAHQGNSLMQLIKTELERHEEHQKLVLEEERRQQLLTVSSALQSALQHLTCAINNNPKTTGGDSS